MATRKRKPAKRKHARRGGTRRRRGLGDLLSDRATLIALKVARAGKKPNAAKIEAAAAASLCREGHKSYCDGAATRRSARMARKADRAANRCSQLNAERIAAGLKPKPCEQTVSPATVAASNARAENKGCSDTKSALCVDKVVAITKSTFGKKKEHLRKGCHRVKGVPGAFRCSKKAIKRATTVPLYGPLTPAQQKAARRAHPKKGWKIVTAKVAKKKEGGLKKGCVRRKGHFECTKTAAGLYLAAAKRRKRK